MNIYAKSLFLITICTIISITCYAQNSGIRKIDRNEEKDLERPADVFRIGVTPSALLNTYIGIQMNAAINFSNKIQFNMEAGLITSNHSFSNTRTKGHRIRPALRWYVTDGTEFRVHLSLGYNIRTTQSHRISSFSFPNENLIASFAYEQERKVKGPVFLVGFDYWISRRIVLDIGFGLGSGKINVIDIDPPEGGTKNVSLISTENPGIHNYPILILNIRFQYAF